MDKPGEGLWVRADSTKHETDQSTGAEKCVLCLSRSSENKPGPQERRGADGQTDGDRERQERYRGWSGRGQTQVCSTECLVVDNRIHVKSINIFLSNGFGIEIRKCNVISLGP